MFPFTTKPKGAESKIDDKFTQDISDIEQHGAQLFKQSLKSAYVDAQKQEPDGIYTPFLHALGKLLVELNQQEGLSVYITSLYVSNYRYFFDKHDASYFNDDYKKIEDSPCLNVTLSFECAAIPKLKHPLWKADIAKPEREFAIYYDENNVMCLSEYTRRSYIHDYKAARIGTSEAAALVMEWVSSYLENRALSDVRHAKYLKVIDNHLTGKGLSISTQSSEPQPQKLKIKS